MKVIIVTGTPGTGKTTLAKQLAKKLDFHYLGVNKIIKEHNISEGYDIKRDTEIVDTRKLNIVLIKEINNHKNKGMIIDYHLSHYLPKRYVDVCIVTKCDLKELEARLRKKDYSRAKVKENLDSEIFDICLNEAKERKHEVFVINTSKGININEISRKIRLKQI